MPLIEKSVGFKKAKKAGSAMLPAFFVAAHASHAPRRLAQYLISVAFPV